MRASTFAALGLGVVALLALAPGPEAGTPPTPNTTVSTRPTFPGRCPEDAARIVGTGECLAVDDLPEGSPGRINGTALLAECEVGTVVLDLAPSSGRWDTTGWCQG